MIKKKAITLIQADDWIGIYIDGKLKREDHSFDVDDVLSILGIDYEQHWIDMEDGSRLPATLGELKEKLPKLEEKR